MELLSLTYLGNIQWYSKLCFEECLIDIHEHYVKQSYRTRCDILGANGPASLVMQTVKGSNFNKVTTKDTRIDYSKRWQHQHWVSLLSAYKNSPYFDHYESLFAPFYTKRYDFLLDYDLELTETVLRLLGSTATLRLTDRYIDPEEMDPTWHDWRNAMSPKPRLSRPDPAFVPEPYYQVFAEKMPFVPNLSIIDLLMCEGPEALTVIQHSHRP